MYAASLQVELTGSSVFDYIHPADHVEMAERLGIRPHLRAEAGCHTAPESASSSASTSSLAGTPEPGTFISPVIGEATVFMKSSKLNNEHCHFFYLFFLAAAPSSPHASADDPTERGFFIRMKSTLTKRGLHVKSSGYKVCEKIFCYNLKKPSGIYKYKQSRVI